MSDSGPAPSFLRKRVAGVPVLYLGGAGAVILAVVAWRTKSTPATTATAATTATDPNAVVTAGDTAPSGQSVYATPSVALSPYQALVPYSTTYASAGQAAPDTTSAPAIQTNSDWLSQGVTYLISQGKAGGDAQQALQLYLSGAQLSITQGSMRDMVIKQFGLPPDPPGSTTTATPAPKPTYTGFIRLAGSSNTTIWGVRSDHTREALSAAQYAALGHPTFVDLPPTAPEWAYPTVGAYSDPIIPS